MRASTALLFLLPALAGCNRTFTFDLEVTVTNEADGTPVAGATVRRNMWGEKTDPKTPETVLVTDTSGRAAESCCGSSTAFSTGNPTWYLRVSKEGFEPQVVEFKPAKVPRESHSRLEAPVPLKPLER
jgi:hypothetical protein